MSAWRSLQTCNDNRALLYTAYKMQCYSALLVDQQLSSLSLLRSSILWLQAPPPAPYSKLVKKLPFVAPSIRPKHVAKRLILVTVKESLRCHGRKRLRIKEQDLLVRGSIQCQHLQFKSAVKRSGQGLLIIKMACCYSSARAYPAVTLVSFRSGCQSHLWYGGTANADRSITLRFGICSCTERMKDW